MFKSELRQLKLSRNSLEVPVGQRHVGGAHNDCESDNADDVDVRGDDLLWFETDDF